MRARDRRNGELGATAPQLVGRTAGATMADPDVKRLVAAPLQPLDVLRVQRLAGNRAVQQVLRTNSADLESRSAGPGSLLDYRSRPTCPAVQRDTPAGAGSGARAPTNPPTPPQPP